MFAAGKAASGAEPTDAQFNYVTMLLHGNGTNGAQNNTFLDSSTNNFTITRNGNTTQGTFTPYGSNWSNIFNATSDKLTLSGPNLSSFTNFTVEFWVNFNGFQTDAKYFLAVSGGTYCQLVQDSSGGISLRVSSGYIKVVGETSNSGWTVGTWYHVALVKNGNDYTIYKNGVSIATNTYSTALPSVTIGYLGGFDSTTGLNAYMSNIRITNTAVYTSAFTPSTIPLTAISGTQLLTSQSNRFVDNSASPYTLTASGSPSVQRFSPFSPTTAYSTSVIGGSGYFDGSGDYLSVSNSGLFGSGDWSIEFWVNAPVGQTDKPIIDARNSAGGSGSTTGFTIGMISSTEIRVWSNGEKIRATANYVNQWLHFALVKSGSTTTMYFNGVSVGTTTAIGTMSDTSFLVGGGYYGSTSINAYGNFYTSNMRVVKGSAVYTSNFTPPTAPVTAISSTALLMDYTNAGILDNAMMNDLETVGNAQISTSVKKYGTGSMYFDGTTDYIVEPTNLNFGYGTGDFTIEFWLYLNSTGLQTVFSNLSSDTSTNPHLYISTTIRYFTASADRITGATLSTATWYHIALCRSSGSTKLFINGTQSGSTYTDSNNYGSSAPLGIGTYWSGGSPVTSNNLNGYIDDLRITKGFARYTANFTAPTAAFADKG